MEQVDNNKAVDCGCFTEGISVFSKVVIYYGIIYLQVVCLRSKL